MKDTIYDTLLQAFKPQALEVRNDSHKHAGHAEAKRHGGGHFAVRIVAKDFAGKNALARHRMVYKALDDIMQDGHIHALQIHAYSPDEIDENASE